ncbi:hypothetical protein [Paraburkholderia sp. SIMBA_030]
MTSGQIALDAVELKSYPFAELEVAIDAAGRMSGLQCTVVEGKSPQAWG